MSGQQPAGQQNQQEVFQQFAADELRAGAAAAIKFHRAKGNGQRRLKEQGAMEHQPGERHQHHHQRQGRSAHRDASQQQQSAKHFKPRQGRGHRIQKQGALREVVLPQQFQKIHGIQRLVQAHVKKHRAQQPPRQHGGDVHGEAAPGCLIRFSFGSMLRKFPLLRAPVSTGRLLVVHSVIPPP